MRHDIASAFDGAPGTTRPRPRSGCASTEASAFDSARHDTAATMAGLRHDMANVGTGVRHDVAAWGNDMIHAVTSISRGLYPRAPARSMAASNRRGRQAFTEITRLACEAARRDALTYRNVIDGLIHGIESSALDILGTAKSLAGEVESYFTDPG